MIEYKGKLLSVDRAGQNRIFEFKHTIGNKYHGFLQRKLPEADAKRVRELFALKEGNPDLE